MHSFHHHPSYDIVGSDYTTLTGNDYITARFSKGSNTAIIEILIQHDLLDEDDEYFTAELQSESNETSTSATSSFRTLL